MSRNSHLVIVAITAIISAAAAAAAVLLLRPTPPGPQEEGYDRVLAFYHSSTALSAILLTIPRIDGQAATKGYHSSQATQVAGESLPLVFQDAQPAAHIGDRGIQVLTGSQPAMRLSGRRSQLLTGPDLVVPHGPHQVAQVSVLRLQVLPHLVHLGSEGVVPVRRALFHVPQVLDAQERRRCPQEEQAHEEEWGARLHRDDGGGGGGSLRRFG